MHFLIDAQLHPSLVHFFDAQLVHFFIDLGHEATRVFELFTHDAADEVIVERAIALASVVVTKDEDFAIRSDARGAPPQILWLRIGHCRNGPLVKALAASIATACKAFERGERIVEIRSH